MSQYDTTLDPSVSNNSHVQLLDLVGGGKDVLDVGCSTGYLAEALTQRGCTVSGIEYDAEAAELARPHLDRLVVGDLNTLDLAEAFGERRFEVIVLGDVLEHLADPAPVLGRLVGLLAPGGSVVISIPNVSHGSIRLALLQGSWEYQELGLMDRTHIRFFTRCTLLAMLRGAGLSAVDVRTTVKDPLASEVVVDVERLPAGVVEWVREQPDALTYQFLVRAVVDDAAGAVEASRLEREELRVRLAEAQGRVAHLERALERARGDVDAVLATRTVRALAVPRAVYGRLRRVLGGRAR
ncbi:MULTISPECIES: bifunctional 2-polyprenyl-6-hydroxyphenol methylase/3-demethylubiquinol 3-O-methyltransferase UbiG [unclassified Actinotalea]|uniref:class I SAM-dependent methyltransferase n=1 Tax=unclassified Actinotalea TaxID=2638618 RepID=UPI0015F429D1|nr:MULTISPECIES: class I SAM-dependent methyltransferase [unclassified Actinotalea]